MSIPAHAERQVLVGSKALDPEQLEVAPGRENQSVQGWIPKLATEEEVRGALEKAFDYRGDVTITRKDGTTLEGYIFDRVSGKTLETSLVMDEEVLGKESGWRGKRSVAAGIFRRVEVPTAWQELLPKSI